MYRQVSLFCSIGLVVILAACNSSSGNPEAAAPPPQALPVISVAKMPVTIYKEFNASLEGTKNVEIRPQVDGYLEKIEVDEGAYVHKGQVLFRINDQPYREQLGNAKAALLAAKANQESAQLNVTKLTPLVQNNVVSEVQLKSAQAAYDAAKANVAQAEAMERNAGILLDYAVIRAPVDGYIGRIPFKTGSLAQKSATEALTLLSEVKEVYAYFSMTEKEFLQFTSQVPGRRTEEKVRNMPPVELQLADNTIYPQKGRVQTVSGQFDKTMGAISFRAIFPNADGMLRSGNTGKIRLPQNVQDAVVVPQEASFELQDKLFVMVVGDSNKVSTRPITLAGSNGNYYLVNKGLQAGDKIVYSGLDRLRDGMVIVPQPMSLDSLVKARPM